MFSFKRKDNNDCQISLKAYFRDAVFDFANPRSIGLPDKLREFTTDQAEAKEVAKILIHKGIELSYAVSVANDAPVDIEGGIVATLDITRKELGLPVPPSVAYRAGDVDDLWPDLKRAKPARHTALEYISPARPRAELR